VSYNSAGVGRSLWSLDIIPSPVLVDTALWLKFVYLFSFVPCPETIMDSLCCAANEVSRVMAGE
jgi:hypothetical protein